MDMPIGKIRIRANGKSGGHNGIKSIIRDLGTDKFNRLKIGIRHPPAIIFTFNVPLFLILLMIAHTFKKIVRSAYFNTKYCHFSNISCYNAYC